MNFLCLIFFFAVLNFVKSDECNCRLRTKNRVVNGEIAVQNSFPWLVSLAKYKKQGFCGGSIMNEKYILTAAHCLTRFTPEEITVRVGMHNIDDDTPED